MSLWASSIFALVEVFLEIIFSDECSCQRYAKITWSHLGYDESMMDFIQEL